jgi:hypothetical protein
VKTKYVLVSNVNNKGNYEAYLACEDQKVEIEARSREGQVFIQKGAVHRSGIR